MRRWGFVEWSVLALLAGVELLWVGFLLVVVPAAISWAVAP